MTRSVVMGMTSIYVMAVYLGGRFYVTVSSMYSTYEALFDVLQQSKMVWVVGPVKSRQLAAS